MGSKVAPQVSVVITCYNYSEYVAEAIESLLRQTYLDNMKITVIDDGSTDDSLDVINKYKKQINIISRKNMGIVYTRNQGLEIARKDKSKYICFLDADDFFNNNYIEEMVEVAEVSSADVVYPNWKVFGDDDYIREFPDFDINMLIRQELHCTAESLIKVSATKGHLFESEKVAEDWDFFLGMALSGKKFINSKKSFINYRVKKGSRGSSRSFWDDSVYFFDILKKWDLKYPNKIDLIGFITGAGRRTEEQLLTKDKTIRRLNIQLKDVTESLNKSEELLKSRRYKLADKIVELINTPSRIVSKLRRVFTTCIISFSSPISEAKFGYKVRKSSKINRYAVVLHLFHEEMWDDVFSSRLKKLYKLSQFDLYVNTGSLNGSVADQIRLDFPGVVLTSFSNKGRDVRPFLLTYGQIINKKYEAVLKLHSKKSDHTDGGSDWLSEVLDVLIPKRVNSLEAILDSLKGKETIAGPKSLFVALSLYYENNIKHIQKLFKSHNLDVDKLSDYGFFAGTMFWVSGGCGYLNELDLNSFEKEAGQTDGTYAHALERYISVYPQLKKHKIYGINSSQSIVDLERSDIRHAREVNDWGSFINE